MRSCTRAICRRIPNRTRRQGRIEIPRPESACPSDAAHRFILCSRRWKRGALLRSFQSTIAASPVHRTSADLPSSDGACEPPEAGRSMVRPVQPRRRAGKHRVPVNNINTDPVGAPLRHLQVCDASEPGRFSTTVIVRPGKCGDAPKISSPRRAIRHVRLPADGKSLATVSIVGRFNRGHLMGVESVHWRQQCPSSPSCSYQVHAGQVHPGQCLVDAAGAA
jgi:hypothetical protein